MNIKTVVKFYKNPHQHSQNPIITRTLLKVGIIDNQWRGQVYPQDGEIWLVRINRETCPGMNKGCFILSPLQKIEPKDLSHIVPGMYDEQIKNGILHIRPKSGLLRFPILTLTHKDAIQGYTRVSNGYRIERVKINPNEEAPNIYSIIVHS